MINIQFGTSRNHQSLVRMVLFNGSNIPIFVTYNYPNHPKIIPKSSQNHPNFTISPVYTIYNVCGLQWLTTIPITPKSSQFYNITSLYYIQCVACSGLQLSQSPQNDPNFTISPVYTILGSLNNIHIYIFVSWIYQETWGFLTDLFGFLINL